MDIQCTSIITSTKNSERHESVFLNSALYSVFMYNISAFLLQGINVLLYSFAEILSFKLLKKKTVN